MRKAGGRLTVGWRCNGDRNRLIVAKHIPQNETQRHVAKAPARRTVRRAPGACGLIPGWVGTYQVVMLLLGLLSKPIT
jgi:hypothetical protein